MTPAVLSQFRETAYIEVPEEPIVYTLHLDFAVEPVGKPVQELEPVEFIETEPGVITAVKVPQDAD